MTAVVPADATAGRVTVSLLMGPLVQSDDIFNPIFDGSDLSSLNKIQYTGSGTLTATKGHLAAAAVGDKILIAGGEHTGGLITDYDIYNITNGTWQSGRLSQSRTGMSVAGITNKILVAGGRVGTSVVNTVDIYDVNSNTWTTSQLSVARTNMAAVGCGSEVFFAGGLDETGKPSKHIDIYNVVTGKWRIAALSVARDGMVAATASNKVVFAGGNVPTNPALHGRVVDIYNADQDKLSWSTATLTVPRFIADGFAGAGNGRLILFAGGASNDQDPFIEVYNAVDNAWGTLRINEEIRVAAAAAAGTKIVFSQGKGRSYVYDILTATGVSVTHAGQTVPTVAAGIRNKIIFAGGPNFDQYTLFK
ncbi:hypothetical protein GCM10028827_24790 [Mucilaginibacter myungsuensis]